MRGTRRIASAWLTATAASVLVATCWGQQAPARRRVLFDEAHHNLQATASGGYRPFVVLAQEAGFYVTSNSTQFRAAELSAADVVVIANPSGAGEASPIEQRAQPAFTPSEVAVLREWVFNGGGLLLVTDHYPTGVAAQVLGGEFGVRMSGGWTDDPNHRQSLPGYGPIFGHLMFSRANGLLSDHPLTRGRNSSERVDAIVSTTGESLVGPVGSTRLLMLSSTAVDWVPRDPRERLVQSSVRGDFNPCPGCETESSSGRSQGLAFEFGRGRLVVLGEMGILVEFSVPGTDNRQFAVNVVRWLAHDF
jgi:hypothetical protein